MMTIAANLWWLSLCVYHEARGEPFEGQVAVAQVILNRVEKRRMSVEEVVKEPDQFSWYNEEFQPDILFREYYAMEFVAEAVMACLKRRFQGDTFHGADHYFNHHLVKPSWAADMRHIKTIANHTFYRSK